MSKLDEKIPKERKSEEKNQKIVREEKRRRKSGKVQGEKVKVKIGKERRKD